MTQRLDRLLQQQERLKAQIQKEESKTKKQNRKDDTRRKILIGAVVMEAIKKDDVMSSQIKKLLAGNLTRDNDRKLFELPFLNKES